MSQASNLPTVSNPNELEQVDSQNNVQMIGAIGVAAARAAQEVQAAMVIAKRFPRDEVDAFGRVMKACKRKSLAETAIYEYPRGGSRVTGPSIRLAEVLAQAWGNLDHGWTELERRNGESTVMCYAWDLETNSRKCITFTVRHEREVGTKGEKRISVLTDPRDIYEMCANQAARRVRNCILAVIPGDVCDEALSECAKTLAGGNTTPISDRTRQMVVAFDEFSVSASMIEARLGHSLEAISEHELVGLRRVYQSLKDGMGSRDDYFTVSATPPGNDPGKSRTENLANKVAPPKAAPASTPAAAPTPPTEAPAAEKKTSKKTEPAPAPADKPAPAKAPENTPPAAAAATPDAPAGSTAPQSSEYSGVIAALAAKCDVPAEAAKARLDSFIGNVWKKQPEDLSPVELADLAKKVADGFLVVKKS